MRRVPGTLAKLTDHYEWKQIVLGESAASTFLLEGASNNQYLKIQPVGSGEGLYEERERLDWLSGKLPVPQVLFYDKDAEYEYLLISEIKGINASSRVYEADPKKLMKLLGKGLRQIHTLEIHHCPFDQSLSLKLIKARERMEENQVDESDFDDMRQGVKAEALLEELFAKKPSSEDLVFTHGDYCLPNIIVDGGAVSGFIDWGRAGVSDRYQDIALAIRSIIRNFGECFVPDFLRAYGITAPDESKIYYYQLLDEFY